MGIYCEKCRYLSHTTEEHDGLQPVNFPRVGAATFVIKGTEILLGRSKKLNNQIVIPSGGIKPFETVNDAARREVLEKTGIACLVQDILFVSEYIQPPQGASWSGLADHRIVIYMLGQYVDGEPFAGDDLSEVFWADTRELAKYQNDMTDMTVDAIYKFSIALRSRSMTQRAN